MNKYQLKRNIELCKKYKKHVQGQIYYIHHLRKIGHITEYEYRKRMQEKHDGHTCYELVDIYDKNISSYTKKLEKQKPIKLTYFLTIFIIIAAIMTYTLLQNPNPYENIPFETQEITIEQFIYTAQGNGEEFIINTTNDVAVPEGVYTVKIEPQTNTIIEIKIETHDSSKPSFDLVKLNSPSYWIKKQKVISAYAMNYPKEKGSITVTAKGKQLWQCLSWNVTSTSCMNEWSLIRNITPGYEYTTNYQDSSIAYAETLEIINVQSYPTVQDNWEVKFRTHGRADLTIRAIDGTSWSRDDVTDLHFLELKCGDEVIPIRWKNNEVTVRNYECDELSSEISKVITPGKHHLQFQFGEHVAEAHNLAGSSGFVFLDDAVLVTPAGTGSWTAIDASVYGVPENATGVLLALVDTATGNHRIFARHPDSTDNFYSDNTVDIRKDGHNYLITAINESGVFEGIVENADGRIYLIGYTDEEITLFTNEVDVTSQYTGSGSWQDLDVSAVVPADAKGIIVRVNDSGTAINVRANTATTDWRTAEVITRGWYVAILKNNDQIIEGYRNDVQGSFHILGYVGSGAPVTFFTDPINVSYDTDIGDWTTIDVTAETSSKANGALLIRYNGFADFRRGLTRPTGSSVGWYSNSDVRDLMPHYEWVGLDSGQEFSSRIEDVAQDYFLIGYTEEYPWPPNITNLSQPQNNSIHNISKLEFNFTAEGDTSLNCTYYANFSGTWEPNATNESVTSEVETNVTITVNDGIHAWSVQCNDTYGQTANYGNNTVTIDTNSPIVSAVQFNESIVNQSNPVLLNMSITDLLNVTKAQATIKYPNGTSVGINLSNNGDEYYLIITDTVQLGIYNFTQIIVNDSHSHIETTVYYDVNFTIITSPPGVFDLSSPTDGLVTTNTTPILTWEQTIEENFTNYTVQIDDDILFANPNYINVTYEIDNTSVNVNLVTNKQWYWRVIAFDTFGSSTISTTSRSYITDTTDPFITLNWPTTLSLSNSFNFNFTPIDQNLTNCSLYGNFNDTWMINQTNSSPINNTDTFFPITLADNNYTWAAECYDRAINSFLTSNVSFMVDTTDPAIQLESPDNETTELVTNNILFEYNVTDVMMGIASCFLVLNGTQEGVTDITIAENQTQNFTAFLENGVHSWRVNCTDANGYMNTSLERVITVFVTEESDPPVITPYFPGINQHLPYENITFNYTPDDATGIENCSLFIDDEMNDTDFDVEVGVFNYFTISNISEIQHSWYVECFDNSSTANDTSSTLNFTIDLTDPIVTLEYPDDDSFYKFSSVTFNYTPTELNLENCSLYANFTGTFKIDQYNNSPAPNVTNTFTKILSDGLYEWNIECNDSSKRNVFDDVNYTVKVDALQPILINESIFPSSPINYTPAAQYQFNITLVESFLDTIQIEHNFSGTLTNYSLSEHEGNIYIYNYSLIPAGSYAYRWNVNDSFSRYKNTSLFTYDVDKTVSIINLTLEDTDGNIVIDEEEFANLSVVLITPTTGYIELYNNGTRINSGQAPLWNNTLFSEPGIYNITAVYNESDNYTYGSDTHLVTVNDITDPTIIPTFPEENDTIGFLTISFTYNVTDNNAIKNCSLYMNDTFRSIDYSVENGVQNSFMYEFSGNGAYDWYVQCYDNSGNQVSSNPINYTVQETSTILINTTTDASYEYGSVISILTTLADEFGSQISDASILADVIWNTTDYAWYDDSLPYRKQIDVEEQDGENQTYVQVNITVNTQELITAGKANDNCTDFRFADVYASNVPYYLVSGCDSATTLFTVRMNLTANANTSLFLYYGDASATNVSSSNSILGIVGEMGKVSVTDGEWERVSYANEYSDPLVFGTINTENEAEHAMVTEVQNKLLSSFEIRTCEINYQVDSCEAHAAETVAYLVLDCDLINETPNVVCGQREISGGQPEKVKQDFGEVFSSTAYVWGTVQTRNENEAAVNVQYENVSDSYGEILICEQSDTDVDECDSTHVAETVAWLAIASNHNPFTNTIINETTGVEDGLWNATAFNSSFSEVPAVVAMISTASGAQEVEVPEIRSINSSGMNVRLCEFDSGNGCNSHNPENINWLAAETGNILLKLNPTTNPTSYIDEEETHVVRNSSTTDVNGEWTWDWNTIPYQIGNYSVVSYSSISGLIPGWNSSQFEITPDTTAPSIASSQPINESWWQATTLNFSYTPSDSAPITNCSLVIDDVQVTYNETVVRDVVNNLSYGIITEGQHNWWINCTDYSNNTNVSLSRNFSIDFTDPNASITSPVNKSHTNETSLDITIVLTDAVANILNYAIYRGATIVDSDVNISNNTPKPTTITLSGEGYNNIYVESTDQAGNEGNSSMYSFLLDQTAPTIFPYDPDVDEVLNVTTIMFNFTYTDQYSPNASCTLNIDGWQTGPYTVYDDTSYNQDIAGFTEGQHSWNVSCQDTAGNTGVMSSQSFTIDTTGPTIELTDPETNSYTNSSGPTFSFTYSDASNPDTCWLVLNGTKNETKTVGLAQGSNSITVSYIADGLWNWTVNCSDETANEGTNTDGELLNIDTLPPSAIVLESPGNESISNNLTPIFTWQQVTEEHFSNYILQVDDSITFTSVDQSFLTSDITNTSIEVTVATNTMWYWRVIAQDIAGNSRYSSYFVHTTDTSEPTVLLKAPPGDDNDPDGNITFFYTVSDLTLASCELYTNITGVWSSTDTDLSPQIGLNLFPIYNISLGKNFVWNVYCIDDQSNVGFGTNRTVTIGGPSAYYQNFTIDTALEVTDMAPSVSGVVMIDPIDLYAGSNRTLSCNATIIDMNGLLGVTTNATFFHSTSDADAVDAEKTHYSNTSCGCSVLSNITQNCICSFDVMYLAKNGTWTCNVSATDGGQTGSSSLNVTVNELYAINVTDGIDYGSLEANDISNNVTANITNLGNVELQVNLSAYGSTLSDSLSFVCPEGSDIPVSYERVAPNATALYSEKIAMTGSTQSLPGFALSAADNSSNASLGVTYWQVQAPASTTGVCTGKVVFIATG